MVGKVKEVAFVEVPNKRVFSVDEASRYLGCDRKTLYHWTQVGLIPAKESRGPKGNRRRLYLLEFLDAFIDSLPSWKDNPSCRKFASAPTTEDRGV